jgi:D-alanyl-D-alanine carboxypeptidase
MLRFPRVLTAAVAIGAALVGVPASSPPPALGLGPLPTCRLDDILTVPRGYDDWSVTLVDWILTVGPDYKPPDLVSVSGAGVTGGGRIRAVAFDDLKAMAEAARAHGTPLGNVSAYRSYRQQKALFNSYVKGSGFDKAITFSARPGHSEHQLGLVLDFAAAGSTSFVSGTDRTGRWLAQNGWKYGWLLSYPKGKKAVVCYRYEPWHYRYVGRGLAKAIHDSGLTIREYLWSHFTTVDPKTGEPLASSEPSAAPATSPSEPAPTAPAPSPSAGPSSSAAGASPTPSPSGPATPPANTLCGLDPSVAIVVGGLVLGAIGLLATFGLRRPRRGRGSR